jgi:lipopolysaccharide transport system ATP-binding protein
MSSEVALHVEGIGKQYQIGAARAQYRTLRDRISASVSGLAARAVRRGPGRDAAPTIWALRDVSFDVRAGEVVGIIGGNGAGKSTLLKILSRITEPTEGAATVYGRVGALLEVGTGFHAELTGRENIFLNGAILGMARAEVARKFDAIVEFAGVGQFIDTAVRFYSSGMYVRLAFAVAAHMEPEILVIDEVLAVGDAQFQKKCLGKMNAVAREGRTVLFVSHNLEIVQRLCGRGLLLEDGRLAADGAIGDVVRQYRALDGHADGLGVFHAGVRRGTGWARVTDIRLLDSGVAAARIPSDADLTFEVDIAVAPGCGGSLQGLTFELALCASDGTPLCSVMSVDDGGAELPAGPEGTVTIRLAAPTFLPGRYRLNTFLGIPSIQHTDEVDDAFQFEIAPPRQPWRPYELNPARGPVARRAEWQVRAPAPGSNPV